MNEKIVKLNHVEIFTESYGHPGDPAILLIAGATVSMLFWEENFCKKLADKGFFVIRYDNRDTGLSTSYPRGTAPYSIDDMVDDAIGVLDSYGIDKAHLVGVSLGGLISQIAVLKYPEQVATLTLFATGPWGMSDPEIPEMDKSVIEFQSRADNVDWSNEDAVVSYMLEGARLMSGNKSLDEKQAEEMIRKDYRRANNYISMFNHATLQGGEEYFDKYKQIKHPVLVIHGTEDKIWPYGHAKVLNRELENSTLLTLEGTGHELHASDHQDMIEGIFELINSWSK